MRRDEYAARHGVTPTTVSKWKKRGLLVFMPDPMRPGAKIIDVQKSDLLVGATIDQSRGRIRTGGASVDAATVPPSTSPTPPIARVVPPDTGDRLHDLRIREKEQDVIRSEFRNRKDAGELVSFAEYERRAADLARRMREALHAMARELAERLAAERDDRALLAILDGAIDEVMVRLSVQMDMEIQAEEAELRKADGILAEELEAAQSAPLQ